jgi:hypothetical protein
VDHNLHNYVKLSIPDHLFEIVDWSILAIELNYNTDIEIVGGIHPNVEKCLLSIFRIALSCSLELPKERMNMVNVMTDERDQWRQGALQPKTVSGLF